MKQHAPNKMGKRKETKQYVNETKKIQNWKEDNWICSM